MTFYHPSLPDMVYILAEVFGIIDLRAYSDCRILMVSDDRHYIEIYTINRVWRKRFCVPESEALLIHNILQQP